MVISAEAFADLVYPDTVATDGGQFSGQFGISNIVDNGFTAPTDTIDGALDAENDRGK